MASVDSQQIMEDENKSLHRNTIAKTEHKKLIGTLAKKVRVLTLGDVMVSFWAKEKSGLQKAGVAEQKAINA